MTREGSRGTSYMIIFGLKRNQHVNFQWLANQWHLPGIQESFKIPGSNSSGDREYGRFIHN